MLRTMIFILLLASFDNAASALYEQSGSNHPFSKFLSGSLLNTMTRNFPFRFDMTSPASSNTERCLAIACREMDKLCFIMRRAVSSYNVISFRSDSSSNMRRRVGSPSALKIASLSQFIFRVYATLRLLVKISNSKVTYNRQKLFGRETCCKVPDSFCLLLALKSPRSEN